MTRDRSFAGDCLISEVAVVHYTRPFYLFASAFAVLMGTWLSFQVHLSMTRLVMSLGLVCGSVLFGLFLNAFAAKTGTLLVDEDSVVLDGKTLARRRAIRSALLARDPAGARLYLDKGRLSRPIELVLGSIDEGEKVLSALGFDPEQRTMTFPLRFGRATVGTDGVLLRRGLSRELIEASRIASVSEEPFGALLTLRDGSTRRLVMRHGDLFATRVEQAILGGEAGALPDLGRGQRTVGDWLGEIRARIAAPESFRSAPLTVADLFRVLESHGASPEHRAVAAAALADRIDDDGRARIRVVAEASASPKLRVALEAAVAGDEAALTEALEQVAEATPAARARDHL